MRVGFITHYTLLYGANRSLLDLIDGLKRYEVSSYVVSPEEGDVTKALQDRGVPAAVVPIPWWMSKRPALDGLLRRRAYRYLRWQRDAMKRVYRSLRALPALVQQLRLWDVDVIYTNSSVTPIGALAAMYLRLPHVWHLREFGDLDYNFEYDWGRNISKRVMGSADALIANSEAVRSYLLDDAASKNTCVIYNGVAWEAEFDRLYDLAQDTPDRLESYTFALVGSVHPQKGQETAIRAVAMVAECFPHVRLLIVGGGYDTKRLKRLADEIGVADKVEFWGYVHNPYKAYLAADAALMCSRNEAMGRVTAEAMAARRPVIGYDGGGTPEIIADEQTGLLYRGGPESLARCMIRFIVNPEWARQLGDSGWHVAREKYSIETYSRKVYQVLCSILT